MASRTVPDREPDGPGACDSSVSCCPQGEEQSVEFGDDRLSGIQRRVRSVAFVAILDTGRPVGVEAIAADLGVSTNTVNEVLGFFADCGSVSTPIPSTPGSCSPTTPKPTTDCMTLVAVTTGTPVVGEPTVYRGGMEGLCFHLVRPNVGYAAVSPSPE